MVHLASAFHQKQFCSSIQSSKHPSLSSAYKWQLQASIQQALEAEGFLDSQRLSKPKDSF
uniref:Uncharacterized protein n=1 Tax=Rhizophora mucronata TaxID=61149 RepID=A0A2P2PJW6_RHIMU